MSRRFTPKVVTANRLREGDVVYLTADDRWSPQHHEAELIEDEAHAQMRLLHAAAQKLVVVGAYLADAKAGAERPRAHPFPRGVPHPRPSNYFHGKQADLIASLTKVAPCTPIPTSTKPSSAPAWRSSPTRSSAASTAR